MKKKAENEFDDIREELLQMMQVKKDAGENYIAWMAFFPIFNSITGMTASSDGFTEKWREFSDVIQEVANDNDWSVDRDADNYLSKVIFDEEFDLPFGQEIFDNGEHINDWAIDWNPATEEEESNGGQEHLIKYENQYWVAMTTMGGETVHHWESTVAPEEDSEEKTREWEQRWRKKASLLKKSAYEKGSEIFIDNARNYTTVTLFATEVWRALGDIFVPAGEIGRITESLEWAEGSPDEREPTPPPNYIIHLTNYNVNILVSHNDIGILVEPGETTPEKWEQRWKKKASWIATHKELSEQDYSMTFDTLEKAVETVWEHYWAGSGLSDKEWDEINAMSIEEKKAFLETHGEVFTDLGKPTEWEMRWRKKGSLQKKAKWIVFDKAEAPGEQDIGKFDSLEDAVGEIWESWWWGASFATEEEADKLMDLPINEKKAYLESHDFQFVEIGDPEKSRDWEQRWRKRAQDEHPEEETCVGCGNTFVEGEDGYGVFCDSCLADPNRPAIAYNRGDWVWWRDSEGAELRAVVIDALPNGYYSIQHNGNSSNIGPEGWGIMDDVKWNEVTPIVMTTEDRDRGREIVQAIDQARRDDNEGDYPEDTEKVREWEQRWRKKADQEIPEKPDFNPYTQDSQWHTIDYKINDELSIQLVYRSNTQQSQTAVLKITRPLGHPHQRVSSEVLFTSQVKPSQMAQEIMDTAYDLFKLFIEKEKGSLTLPEKWEQRWRKKADQEMTDAEIEESYQNILISDFEWKNRGDKNDWASGWFQVTFPQATAEGDDSWMDSFMIYNAKELRSGDRHVAMQIAFDHWYPEEVRRQLVNYIEDRWADVEKTPEQWEIRWRKRGSLKTAGVTYEKLEEEYGNPEDDDTSHGLPGLKIGGGWWRRYVAADGLPNVDIEVGYLFEPGDIAMEEEDYEFLDAWKKLDIIQVDKISEDAVHEVAMKDEYSEYIGSIEMGGIGIDFYNSVSLADTETMEEAYAKVTKLTDDTLDIVRRFTEDVFEELKKRMGYDTGKAEKWEQRWRRKGSLLKKSEDLINRILDEPNIHNVPGMMQELIGKKIRDIYSGEIYIVEGIDNAYTGQVDLEHEGGHRSGAHIGDFEIVEDGDTKKTRDWEQRWRKKAQHDDIPWTITYSDWYDPEMPMASQYSVHRDNETIVRIEHENYGIDIWIDGNTFRLQPMINYEFFNMELEPWDMLSPAIAYAKDIIREMMNKGHGDSRIRKWEQRWRKKGSLTKKAETLTASNPEQVLYSLMEHFKSDDPTDLPKPVTNFTFDDDDTGGFVHDGKKYIWIRNEDIAIRMAEESLEGQVADMLGEQFLSNYAYMSDTDRRMLADEEADSYVRDIDADRAIEEAGLEERQTEIQQAMDAIEEQHAENEEIDATDTPEYKALEQQMEKLVEEARDTVQSNYYDDIYDKLEDPIQYYVHEVGYVRDAGEAIRQGLVSIDERKAAEDAVSSDGWANFISHYDNSYDETVHGVVFFIEDDPSREDEEANEVEPERIRKAIPEQNIEQWEQRWRRKASLRKKAEVNYRIEYAPWVNESIDDVHAYTEHMGESSDDWGNYKDNPIAKVYLDPHPFVVDIIFYKQPYSQELYFATDYRSTERRYLKREEEELANDMMDAVVDKSLKGIIDKAKISGGDFIEELRNMQESPFSPEQWEQRWRRKASLKKKAITEDEANDWYDALSWDDLERIFGVSIWEFADHETGNYEACEEKAREVDAMWSSLRPVNKIAFWQEYSDDAQTQQVERTENIQEWEQRWNRQGNLRKRAVDDYTFYVENEQRGDIKVRIIDEDNKNELFSIFLYMAEDGEVTDGEPYFDAHDVDKKGVEKLAETAGFSKHPDFVKWLGEDRTRDWEQRWHRHGSLLKKSNTWEALDREVREHTLTLNELNEYFTELTEQEARRLFAEGRLNVFGVDYEGQDSLIEHESDIDRYEMWAIEKNQQIPADRALEWEQRWRRHGSLRKKARNFSSAMAYVSYLRDTLIPDLYKSDSEYWSDFDQIALVLEENWTDRDILEDERVQKFIKFMGGQLIPDTREAGMDSTAEDLQEGLDWIKDIPGKQKTTRDWEERWRKKAQGIGTQLWIDPNGKAYNVSKEGHWQWMLDDDTKKMLLNEYGIDIRQEFVKLQEGESETGSGVEMLLKHGWVRMSGEGNFEVMDINNSNTRSVIDQIISQYPSEDITISYVAPQESYVKIDKKEMDDIGLDKAIYNEQRFRKMYGSIDEKRIKQIVLDGGGKEPIKFKEYFDELNVLFHGNRKSTLMLPVEGLTVDKVRAHVEESDEKWEKKAESQLQAIWDSYFISPDGKSYVCSDSHKEWVASSEKILGDRYQEFHEKKPSLADYEAGIDNWEAWAESFITQMLIDGWARVMVMQTDNKKEVDVEVAGLPLNEGTKSFIEEQRPTRVMIHNKAQGGDVDMVDFQGYIEKYAGLEEYKEKRDFDVTSEPAGGGKGESNIWVIQRHQANKAGLHGDLRLEDEGVLKSFVIRKPDEFLDGKLNRTVVINTEDHPIEYAEFEGDIPDGEYGGGHMDIADGGKFETIEKTNDKWMVDLEGKKLNGIFTLTKADPEKYGEDKWFLEKSRVAEALARNLTTV